MIEITKRESGSELIDIKNKDKEYIRFNPQYNGQMIITIKQWQKCDCGKGKKAEFADIEISEKDVALLTDFLVKCRKVKE